MPSIPSWAVISVLALPLAAVAADPADRLSSSARALEAAARQPPQLLDPDPGVPEPRETSSIPPAESAAPDPPPAARSLAKAPPAVSSTRPAPPRAPRHVVSPLAREREQADGIVIDLSQRLDEAVRSEQVSLFLEGRRVADFDLDDTDPEVRYRLALPGPGRLRYQLLGIIDTPRGRTEVRTRGCINIQPGGRYRIDRRGRHLILVDRP